MSVTRANPNASGARSGGASIATGAFLVASVFTSILCPSVAVAQSNEQLAFTGLARIFGRLDPQDTVVVFPSANLLDPLQDPSDLDQLRASSLQLNVMPKTTVLYTPGQQDLESIYRHILNKAEWAVVPLSSELRAELKQKEKLLYVDEGKTKTKSYETYLRLKSVRDDLQQRVSSQPPNQRDPVLESELQQAEDDLLLLGHSNLFGPAEARYEQLREGASLAWRDSDRQGLSIWSQTSSTGVPFLPVLTEPPLSENESISWTDVTLTGKQLVDATEPFDRSLPDTSSLSPWWKWNPAIRGVNAGCQQSLSRTDFTLQFKLGKSNIRRAWLDERVLLSTAWRSSDFSLGALSNGSIDGNTGVAPAYPVAILLVRDVRLSGPAIVDCLSSVRAAVTAHGMVGFGPFLLAGEARSSSTSFYFVPTIDAKAVKVSTPQVIGFAVKVLPRSPKPDPDFLWPH